MEAVKAIASLKALTDSKSYPLGLTLDGGYITMSSPDEGGGKVRIEGAYLTAALKACGGMVDFKLTDGKSPVLFTADGYQLVAMPMMTNGANQQAKAG